MNERPRGQRSVWSIRAEFTPTKQSGTRLDTLVVHTFGYRVRAER